MNTINTVVSAAALALSGAVFAGNVAVGGSNLGHLTSFPAQFGGGNGPLALPNIFDFTLDTQGDLVGSIGQLQGQVSFSAVSLGELGDRLFPASGIGAVIPWRSATLVPAETGYNFEFKGLAAGNYRLILDVDFGFEPALYSGSIYATPAVPEPGAILLLLAGVAVAGVVVRRRQA